MTNSILVGKVIYAVLQQLDSQPEGQSEGRRPEVYPIIADNDAKFPFVVYKRTSMTTTDTKDGYISDEIQFEVNVVSDKYTDSLNIANNVIKLLRKKQIQGSTLTMNNVILTSATEEYDSGAYIQKLNFKTFVENYN